MWYRRVYFQRLVSDVLVERGDVGVVMEVVGGGGVRIVVCIIIGCFAGIIGGIVGLLVPSCSST